MMPLFLVIVQNESDISVKNNVKWMLHHADPFWGYKINKKTGSISLLSVPP